MEKDKKARVWMFRIDMNSRGPLGVTLFFLCYKGLYYEALALYQKNKQKKNLFLFIVVMWFINYSINIPVFILVFVWICTYMIVCCGELFFIYLFLLFCILYLNIICLFPKMVTQSFLAPCMLQQSGSQWSGCDCFYILSFDSIWVYLIL